MCCWPNHMLPSQHNPTQKSSTQQGEQLNEKALTETKEWHILLSWVGTSADIAPLFCHLPISVVIVVMLRLSDMKTCKLVLCKSNSICQWMVGPVKLWRDLDSWVNDAFFVQSTNSLALADLWWHVDYSFNMRGCTCLSSSLFLRHPLHFCIATISPQISNS